MSENNIKAAEDLTLAANWLRAHPGLPPIYSIHRYEQGVTIGFRVETDAEFETLFALTADDHWRSDHHYDDGAYARIATGNLLANEPRLSLSVALEPDEAAIA